MNDRGITLIELLVVVAVIGILAVALSFSYMTWQGNYRVESQTKGLYSDLMEARTRAMTRSRMHFVVIKANDYAIYEDTNENNAPEPDSDAPILEFRDHSTGTVKPKVLQYNLGGTGTITFDTKGLTDFMTTRTIRAIHSLNPDNDCILVGQSRIRMGKWDGSTCEAR